MKKSLIEEYITEHEIQSFYNPEGYVLHTFYFYYQSSCGCAVWRPQKVSQHIHLMLLSFQSSGVVCNHYSCPLIPFKFDTVLNVIN